MRRAIAVHRAEAAGRGDTDSSRSTFLDRHRAPASGSSAMRQAVPARPGAGAAPGDGDGLELDDGGYIRVCAAPEPVIEIAAARRPTCCASPGTSATGTCRCRR